MIKYLYLDDEEATTIKPYRDMVVEHSKNLKIDIEHPATFQNYSALIKRLQEYQGLILDWRLDEISSKIDKKKADFRAATLAQEIRTRETENKIQPMPIVVWSQENRLKRSYQGDFTSHDLFNVVYKKEDVVDEPDVVHDQLIALALGYQYIDKFKSAKRKFDLSELLKAKEHYYVDIRVQEYFSSTARTVHEIARFILQDLLRRPGLLIDELRLASRLGINQDASKDWSKILGLIKEYKYSGPFGEAWERWWAFGVEKEWWIPTSGQNSPISLLNAKERVEIIKKKTGFRNLMVAEPIYPKYHTRFYTICEYTKKPLDPIDGVIIAEKEPQPWQERRYISLDTALERREGFDPHPTELERLRNLRRTKG
ncbi:MAG: hypothetical protein HY869_22365 [Chloroflexi bacterium]|nr:hypothetical protein [Chloroflexota bacterium]